MRVLMTVSCGLLCIGALAFPFSVAVANIALGFVLFIGVFSGIWWQGAKQFWSSSRNLLLVLGLYFALMFLGIIWSLDPDWGIRVIGRQWFWLLVPIIVVLLREERWRNYFLISLSAGLALNLAYCILQMLSYVEVTTNGSNFQNATGHIGHIGFGEVYGVWASWLLYLGWQKHGNWRWMLWMFAVWSYVMVFSAHGRGGYVVALALMIIVIFERFRGHHPWRPVALVMFVGVVVVSVFAMGPGKERLLLAWNSLSQVASNESSKIGGLANLSSTEVRIEMFKTSVEVWQAHPWLGAGTGGVAQAVSQLGDLENGAQRIQFFHPHNQYVFNLARWGLTGLLLILAVFYFWMREGWKHSWNSSMAFPLVALTGAGLMIHGLFAPAMEEHFSGVLAALLLGTGLSTLNSES